ncbi:MAG: type 3 dihydrofolate reductase [Idiomarina sp.]|nr:type 3 dihydrofolate reductase [Idiomarina sp.]
MQHISLVAAMANDRVIGREGGMPWHLPDELQYFKEITMGKPMIMGRTTFESIGRPLPGRRNIVVSRSAANLPEGVEHAESPAAALALCQDAEEVMVIGGGQIYREFLPLATRMYLTHIELSVDGDTTFPDWSGVVWQRKLLREVPEKSTQSPAYAAYLYEKST